MRKQKLMITAFVLAICVFCTACTSAFSNAGSYFSNVNTIVKTMANSGKAPSPTGTGAAAGASSSLGTPANFTLDASGNYSFTGVEGADHYMLYFCDPSATKDTDDFIYSSDSIPSNSSGKSYTGKCSDIVKYAYGKYLVKLFACPALDDSKHTMSSSAAADFTVSGAQDNPQIDYFWNTFAKTMDLQLSNVSKYTYEAYPDKVDITFTNTNNSSDKVVVTLKDISDKSFSIKTDALKQGETYDITAVATSSCANVTNQTSDTAQVGKGVKLGVANIITEGYKYSDGIARGAFNYPRLCANFNLASGGSAGDVNGNFGKYSFMATPTTATAGSKYSYNIDVKVMGEEKGMLELKADGTLLMYETGFAPVDPTYVSGIWADNGDGTATLSFNPDTVKIGKVS